MQRMSRRGAVTNRELGLRNILRCIMIFYGITARLSYQTMQIGFFRMATRRSTSAGRDKASTTNKRNCKEFVIQHKNSFVQFAIDMKKP